MADTTQGGADRFCKLPITRKRMKPSFKNKVALLKKVDKLPPGTPWICDILTITGNRLGPNGQPLTEEVELWRRSGIGLTRELIGNPAFDGSVSYKPVRVTKGGERYYGEMNTADWWWDTQGKLPAGATIAPLLLASDKTQLTVLRGDKTAWPVYLTIGNIDKAVRRKPSLHGALLLGYIPVAKLKCFSDDERSDASYRLFHACMAKMLAPLIEAGKTGVKMTCADGEIRLVFPILAAYIADHPEQCLVACCKESRCPRCVVPFDERGDLHEHPLRDHASTVNILEQLGHGITPDEYTEQGLRPIIKPFWADLPHTDIFSCFTPDFLHQIHKGVIKDHLLKWCQKIVGKDELDARFSTLSQAHGLRHFAHGISLISQWTGTEAKEIEKTLLGLLVGQADPDVLRATRALLDFIYYAQYEVHSDTTLTHMRSALVDFHFHKDAFVKLGIRKAFNIPKLHSLLHYIEAIRRLGCADGFNTEHSERLHIDFAKDAFRASSKREYIAQMTTWLQRQEAVVRQNAYLAWVQGAADELDVEGDEDNDSGVDGEDNDMGATSRDDHDGASLEDVKALRELINSNIARAYQLPLHPTVSRVSITTLVTEYGATALLSRLDDYVRTHHPTSTRPTASTPFQVYHYVHLLLPPNIHIANTKRICKLRASPYVPRKDDHKPVPAHFDCGLFIDDRELYEREGGLKGLRPGEVRAIFRMPSTGGYVSEPFMYVRWFRPFRNPDHVTGLHPTSHSTRNHYRHVGVVPVRDLVRTCHLMPKYDTEEIDPDWTSANILDQPITFLLNRYLDYHLFSALS
ncbi:hypothetical protein C8Q76DRAFT_648762 [Earliella scabrosa]|nr:hypothetical protein C8Q76DRAFT_648762 [Earliella scabrosa]